MPTGGLSFEPLTPTQFLDRARLVHANRTALTDPQTTPGRRFTYQELHDRCARLAGALLDLDAGGGGRVAVLSPNTHLLLEAHYGVPMAGAVLVAMNQRLTPEELAWIVDHAGARVLLYDHSLAGAAHRLAELASPSLRLVQAGPGGDYESLLEAATPSEVPVDDEMGLLSVNYTSGTTGRPKGVMYSHRGAYLQALAMVHHARLEPGSVFLWTLPMFHCNGWCFTWAVTAAGAAHTGLAKVDPAEVWRLIREEGVTHLNGAPTVLTSLAWHPDAQPPPQPVKIATGGAPPSPTLLARMDELGIEVTHLYGLTETYGPVMVCDWHPEWDGRPAEDRARLKARQGVANVIAQRARVVDGDGRDVPADGQTIGEVALRGNNVMLGYYRDPDATAQAAPDGWFRTGDLGVMHPDGYVELRDRAKDIIISGGENIASVQVEQVLCTHPAVLEAAVVAMPDDHWGEVPVAYVALKPGQQLSEPELIAHARDRLAHFKAPKRVVFGELPKTSTGKIQKFALRDRIRADATAAVPDRAG